MLYLCFFNEFKITINLLNHNTATIFIFIFNFFTFRKSLNKDYTGQEKPLAGWNDDYMEVHIRAPVSCNAFHSDTTTAATT